MSLLRWMAGWQDVDDADDLPCLCGCQQTEEEEEEELKNTCSLILVILSQGVTFPLLLLSQYLAIKDVGHVSRTGVQCNIIVHLENISPCLFPSGKKKVGDEELLGRKIIILTATDGGVPCQERKSCSYVQKQLSRRSSCGYDIRPRNTLFCRYSSAL